MQDIPKINIPGLTFKKPYDPDAETEVPDHVYVAEMAQALELERASRIEELRLSFDTKLNNLERLDVTPEYIEELKSLGIYKEFNDKYVQAVANMSFARTLQAICIYDDMSDAGFDFD